MKKLVFLFAMLFGMSFISCSEKCDCSDECTCEGECVCEEAVDTLVTDSTVIEVVDTVMAPAESPFNR